MQASFSYAVRLIYKQASSQQWLLSYFWFSLFVFLVIMLLDFHHEPLSLLMQSPLLRSWALNECLATKRQWGADCCRLNFEGRKITILDWAKECYIVSSRVWVWNCCQAFWFFSLHLVMRWVSLIIFILSVQRKRVQDLIPIVVLMVNQVLYFCELVQCICFVWCFFQWSRAIKPTEPATLHGHRYLLVNNHQIREKSGIYYFLIRMIQRLVYARKWKRFLICRKHLSLPSELGTEGIWCCLPFLVLEGNT